MSPVRSCFSLCIQRLALQYTLACDCSGGLDLHFEFCLRDVTDGIRPHWKLPFVCWCHSALRRCLDVAWKLENTVPPVIVLSSTHLPRRTPTKVCNFGSIVSPAILCFSLWSRHWRTVALVLTRAIEEKTVRLGTLAVEVKKMRAELCGQERSLLADKELASKSARSCTTHASE